MHGMASVGNVISGVGGIVKDLPYNHLVWKDEGRAALVSSAFGVLLALLDYQTADSRDVPTGGVEPPNPALPAGQPPDVPVAPTAATNSFRYFLAKLHRPGDLEYMLNGVLGIWEQHMSATHHVLPGSRKGVPYILESFLLFWKIIDLNKKFRSYVLESDKLVDVFAYMLWFLLEHKDKPQHHGFCRVLSYMIQVLSGESSFGSKLSQPIPGRVAISARWATPGSVGDFFVTSVYYMVATTSGQLNFLYPALIIALANCAPHLQNLQVISSTRLLQLFTSFSSPAFLLADDGHPRLLFFMLEVLNQIIYHQFSANPNVIYAILRSHKRFESMGTFTLAKGLKEIQRIKEAKEEAERLKSGNPIEKGKTAEMTTPTRSLPESPLTSVDEGSVEKLSSTRTSSDAVLQSIREEETDDPVAVPPTPTAGSERVFPTSAISSPPPPSTRPLSEKARGKMKEQGSVTEIEILDPELERVAAAGVGRNGFVPTQDWVASWQQGLPLDTVLLVISELLPKVHELQASSRPSSVTAAVIDYLKVANLKDVLPQPPSIITRRFQWSDASIIWLSSMIWGEIFVKGTTPLAIWNNTNVKLFGVKHTPQARSVTNFVGGLLGNATGVASGTAQDNDTGDMRDQICFFEQLPRPESVLGTPRVAAYLENACVTSGGNWNVGPLAPGESYVGEHPPIVLSDTPAGTLSDPFHASWPSQARRHKKPTTAVAVRSYVTASNLNSGPPDRVLTDWQVYSLISACAACQNDLWIPWSTWTLNCTQSLTTVAQWPLDVPTGTSIPSWAYQDVRQGDTFNITTAMVVKGPESTYVGTPTASINYHLPTQAETFSVSVLPTATASFSNDDHSSHTNVGAIVGGVVGGVVGIAIVVGAIVWYWLRTRHVQNTVPSPLAYYPEGHPPMATYSSVHVVGDPSVVGFQATSPTVFSAEAHTPPPKLYDPSDPSTYPEPPRTPASFGYSQHSGPTSHSPLVTHSVGRSSSDGRYTGAAEI
ncbi:hypothetical protein FRB99_007774 [Tulasnella sp. 403]|nr:hypothetical protein FRB99_007774 [Tulasnella sp. 403]